MKRVDILEAALKRIANHVEDGESLSGTDCRDIAKDALVEAGRAHVEEKLVVKLPATRI